MEVVLRGHQYHTKLYGYFNFRDYVSLETPGSRPMLWSYERQQAHHYHKKETIETHGVVWFINDDHTICCGWSNDYPDPVPDVCYVYDHLGDPLIKSKELRIQLLRLHLLEVGRS